MQRSNQNIDPHEISEVLLHVALYAGIPAANSAFATAKKVFAQDEGDSKTNRQEEEA
jgi:alkylhydroperoxidase/carboxymuconolactone decarboxylase family protein YurZ